jgi:hypothetical protein
MQWIFAVVAAAAAWAATGNSWAWPAMLAALFSVYWMLKEVK